MTRAELLLTLPVKVVRTSRPSSRRTLNIVLGKDSITSPSTNRLVSSCIGQNKRTVGNYRHGLFKKPCYFTIFRAYCPTVLKSHQFNLLNFIVSDITRNRRGFVQVSAYSVANQGLNGSETVFFQTVLNCF